MEGRPVAGNPEALVSCRRQPKGEHAAEDRGQPQAEEGRLRRAQNRPAEDLLHPGQGVLAADGKLTLIFGEKVSINSCVS